MNGWNRNVRMTSAMIRRGHAQRFAFRRFEVEVTPFASFPLLLGRAPALLAAGTDGATMPQKFIRPQEYAEFTVIHDLKRMMFGSPLNHR
jgi:hypothetical protein